MNDSEIYTGSCHCGAVRFEVAMDAPSQAMACNCSICSRMGWRLAFVSPAQFTLKQGDEALADYQFGHQRAHHFFCRHCGIRSFGRGTSGDGTEMVAINLRCVEGIDAEGLEVEWFDGASL